MNKIQKSFTWAFGVISVVLTFVPEELFGWCPGLINISKGIIMAWKSCPITSEELSAVFGRVIFFSCIVFISVMFSCLHSLFRKKICIIGRNYCIQVEYGDLLKQNGWKVISFDECFTTTVGSAPADIKSASICGQYLTHNPITNMQQMITNAGLSPERERSKYKNQIRYKSGSLIPRNEYLLMAFARLDKDGKGYFASRNEYLQVLSTFWSELDKYYAQRDVCISVLGAGITRIGDVTPTQQELVDMIIYSYKLSPYKIKSKIRIICYKNKEFSLDRVCETL